MADSDDVRLINAKELEKLAYERCGLGAIKFIELIRDMPTIAALPLHSGNKEKEC